MLKNIGVLPSVDKPMFFFAMEHRGDLSQAVATAVRISPVVWVELSARYHFYGYDGRLGDGAARFILNDLTGKDWEDFPVWLVLSPIADPMQWPLV